MEQILYETQKIVATSKEEKIKITCLDDVVKLPQVEEIKDKAQENFLVICLNNKNVIQSIELIGIGTTNCIPMNQSDVIRGALLRGSKSIIMLHNHPSGDSTPSKQDIYFTKRVKSIANYMNIELFDHIIIGEKIYSMAINNQIEVDKYFHELENIVIDNLKKENLKLREENEQLKLDKNSIQNKIQKAKEKSKTQTKNKTKSKEQVL